jgi:hypothetical protein
VRLLPRLVTVLAVALVLWAPDTAEACAVCGAGRDDETRTAFIGTTALLSVLPLALVGGFAWWLRRRLRALDEPAPIPAEPPRR